MSFNSSPRSLRYINRITRFFSWAFHRRRKLAALLIILTLLICPASTLTLKELPVLASSTIATASDSLGLLPRLFKSIFSLFAAKPAQDTTNTRTAAVSIIHISPAKFVGYTDQQVSFSAFGTNSAGATIQGARFSYSSSDTSKLTINDLG